MEDVECGSRRILRFWQIEARANRLLIRPLVAQVGRSYLVRSGLQFELLYERVIRPEYGIRLVENADLSSLCDRKGALGAYCPDLNEAQIDRSMSPDSGDRRRAFTLYHEVCGHGVLQGDWLRAQASGQEESGLVESDETLDPRTLITLERQANAMAAYSAAPMWLVEMRLVYRLRQTQIFVYRGPGAYYLGAPGRLERYEVASFEDYARNLAVLIKHWLGGLSAQALGYRVQRSSIVANATRAPRPLLRAG